jgi:hypothetical protein
MVGRVLTLFAVLAALATAAPAAIVVAYGLDVTGALPVYVTVCGTMTFLFAVAGYVAQLRVAGRTKPRRRRESKPAPIGRIDNWS